MSVIPTRREFLQASGASAAALTIGAAAFGKNKKNKAIQGFEAVSATPEDSKDWKPISDRKVRVGLVGHGVCRFASRFGFQDHPNVEVVAVSDLFPDRCAELAKEARCERT